MTAQERVSLAICRAVNDTEAGKQAQNLFHHYFGRRWVYNAISRRLVTDGMDKAAYLHPDRGVLLCSNHRSFFDQFIIMAALYRVAKWPERVFFPVRSTYFYETWGGLMVNGVIGGFAMYPPIFREAGRTEENKDTLNKLTELMARPGNLVGMHPEGTRGKGPDPYELLPAQPGVGQIIMRGRPIVLPVFIRGMTNSIAKEIASNFAPRLVPNEKIVIVFGEPVEFGGLLEGRPRPAQYKRVADHVLGAISRLGERERVVRASVEV